MSAPRLEIRLDAIAHNTTSMVRRLGEQGISVTAVTKATLGAPEIAATFLAAGAGALGDSRLPNVRRLRRGGIRAPVTLLRTPMLSEVDGIVEHCDISCNTEPEVLAALSLAAVAADRVHGVVLMVELGDLREGIMPNDLCAVAAGVCDLPGLSLRGIGANLACSSGVVPDEANMAELSALAGRVEHTGGLELEIVSGGNSANVSWALGPARVGRINDLRLGEALLLGCDPLDRTPIPGLRTDGATVVAEVIESGLKPTTPWGTRGANAFGEPPAAVSAAGPVQTIVALGRQDTDPGDLAPPEGIEIVASSSDHLVLRGAHPVPVGSEMSFSAGYSAVLRAMTSPTVTKVYLGAEPGAAPTPARSAR